MSSAIGSGGAVPEAGWDEVRPHLDAELDALPAGQRQALSLCYLRGLSQEEASRELRCPVRTVESRVRLGLEKLRARLARRGLAVPGLAPFGPELTAEGLAGMLGARAAAEEIPGGFLASIQALAGGGAATPAALAAAEAVMKAMLWTKLRVLTAAAAGVLVLGLAVPAAFWAARAGEPPTGGRKPAVGEVPAAPAAEAAPVPGKAPARVYGEAVRGLAVSLRVEPAEWKHGEFKRVRLEVALRNTTAERMLVHRADPREPVSWMLSVTDGQGRKWRAHGLESQIVVGPARAEDFITLAPGEEKVMALRLASFLPPAGYFSGLKKDIGDPSKDERIPELPAGEYTCTYRYCGAVEVMVLDRGDDALPAVKARTDALRAIAAGLGFKEFWTGVAGSNAVKLKVLGEPARPEPAPKDVF